MLEDTDRQHLQRCVELAEEALEAGDEPFGSVLVTADGQSVFEDRNRVNTVDATMHPEFEIARWAARHLSREARSKATVYTSGEHCPMCSAAHGWAGLGRIVYVSSAEQLGEWLNELGVAPAPVNSLPIQTLIPAVRVDGPVADLADQIRHLHQLLHQC